MDAWTEAVRSLWLINEITKEAEEVPQVSREEILKIILDRLDCPGIVHRRGLILYANQAARYSACAPDMVGCLITDVVSFADDVSRRKYFSVIDSGRQAEHISIVLACGVVTPVTVRSFPIYWQGEPARVAIVELVQIEHPHQSRQWQIVGKRLAFVEKKMRIIG